MKVFATSLILGGEKFAGPSLKCKNIDEAEEVAKELGLVVDGELVAEVVPEANENEELIDLVFEYLFNEDDRVIH